MESAETSTNEGLSLDPRLLLQLLGCVGAGLSLLSFHDGDPTLWSVNGNEVENLCGRLGAEVARAFLEIFGTLPSMLFWTLLGVEWSRRLKRPAWLDLRWAPTALALWMAISLATLTNGPQSPIGSLRDPGFLGQVTSDWLARQLGGVGTGLLLFGLLIIFLMHIELLPSRWEDWRPEVLREQLLKRWQQLQGASAPAPGELAAPRSPKPASEVAAGPKPVGPEIAKPVIERVSGGRPRLLPSLGLGRKAEPAAPEGGLGEPTQVGGRVLVEVSYEPTLFPDAEQAHTEQFSDSLLTPIDPPPPKPFLPFVPGPPSLPDADSVMPESSAEEEAPPSSMPISSLAEQGSWELPPSALLEFELEQAPVLEKEWTLELSPGQLEEGLAQLQIAGRLEESFAGPRLDTYLFRPQQASGAARLLSLVAELRENLRAPKLHLSPRADGCVTMENPRRRPSPIPYRPRLGNHERTQNLLPVTLGSLPRGDAFALDLWHLPHLILGGEQATGKSTLLRTMLLSLLCSRSPSQLRVGMIDLSGEALDMFQGLPHLLHEPSSRCDQAMLLLETWVSELRQRRTQDQTYDARGQAERPIWLLVVDEWETLADMEPLADALLEELLRRGPESGMHVLLATKNLSIKALNRPWMDAIPARLSFFIRSPLEGRKFLGTRGSGALLEQGDTMLKLPEYATPIRIHPPLLLPEHLLRILRWWRESGQRESLSL